MDVDDAATADELARFRARLRLTSSADLDAYLERNDLDAAELNDLMRADAVARKLRAWLTVRRYKLGLVRPLLDELRLHDEYAGWADAAAARESLLAEVAPRSELVEVENEEVADLVRVHARTTGWRPDTTLATWSEEAGFAQAYDVLIEMKRTQLWPAEDGQHVRALAVFGPDPDTDALGLAAEPQLVSLDGRTIPCAFVRPAELGGDLVM